MLLLLHVTICSTRNDRFLLLLPPVIILQHSINWWRITELNIIAYCIIDVYNKFEWLCKDENYNILTFSRKRLRQSSVTIQISLFPSVRSSGKIKSLCFCGSNDSNLGHLCYDTTHSGKWTSKILRSLGPLLPILKMEAVGSSKTLVFHHQLYTAS